MGEAQNLEWKSSWRDEYLKWICGFANAQGGVLVIGKNDRGEVVGVKNPLRLLEEIPNKTQSLLGIVVDVNLRSEAGGEYLEIAVDPYPNPISYKGEYHYRSGSTKQVLQGAALNRFLLRKHGRNWDDAPMPGVGLKDLDGRTLDEFRRRGVGSNRLPVAVLDESDGDLIEMLRLREGEYLRRAAVLLFHPDPVRFFAGAFVKIGYFRTETDLAYQDVIEGNLFAQVDRSVDLLRTKYSKAEISYEGIYRRETPPAPGEALREAVLNAVAHRDYSNPAPIQIRVYDDRISLWNPGELPPDWTLDTLTGQHASTPHNPAIANAFFRAGMVEAWGRGIGDIVRACRSAGTVEPHWQLEPGGLWLEFVLTRAAAGGERQRRESAAALPKAGALDGTGEKTGEKTRTPAEKPAGFHPSANRTRERMLALIAADPAITIVRMAEEVGISKKGIEWQLRALKSAGRIERIGPDKGGRWRVIGEDRESRRTM